jgi:hypothetical protein
MSAVSTLIEFNLIHQLLNHEDTQPSGGRIFFNDL